MAMFNNPGDARSHFLVLDSPYFYIQGKKGVIFYRNEKEDDVDRASDLLHDFLERNQDTSEMTICTFKELPKSGKVVQCKIEDGDSFTYCNKRQFTVPEKQEFYGSANVMMQQLFKRLEESDRKRDEERQMFMQMLAEREDDQEIEEQSDPNSIAGLLQNPQVMAIASQLIMGIFGNKSEPVKPIAMAGTETPQTQDEINAELTRLLNILFSKGLTLEHLRKLSEYNELKIKSLLMML